jgi:polyhydroxybutyrate depolymerase
LHVPDNFVANSGALVVMLHGSGGSGFQMENGTGMNSRANLTGFAVAYPDGLVAPVVGVTEWHNYFDDGIWAPQAPPDDIGFMRALVNAVTAEIHPDPKKVYVAGISNGGVFAYRVGIEMPDIVAAIGVVEGTLYGFNGNLQGIPPAKAPVSVLIFHGDADTTIPYCETPQIASQEQTFDYWSQTAANQCTNLDSSAPLCDAAGTITSLLEKDATGCGGGVEVKFYRLVGGAHEWYSLPMNVSGQVPYNPDFDSTTGVATNDILWNFFTAHSKP